MVDEPDRRRAGQRGQLAAFLKLRQGRVASQTAAQQPISLLPLNPQGVFQPLAVLLKDTPILPVILPRNLSN